MSELHPPPREDAGAEEALRSGLRAEALSAAAMQRIRRATEAEWRATTKTSPGRRAWPWAAAASVVLLTLVSGWFLLDGRTAAGAGKLGALVRAEAPGLLERRTLRPDRVVAAGGLLQAGQSFLTEGNALLGLAAGGNLRVARDTSFSIESASHVRLSRGEIYVDIPPDAHSDANLVISTPAGEFRHLGTQFALAVGNAGTRLRVREGNVQWRAGQEASVVDAGTELLIDGGEVVRREIAAVGDAWTWAESLAPDIDIENRPLSEFLDWFCRETGRRLVVSDEEVRGQLATIRMHGSVRGMTAMQALSAVMAATSLRVDLPEGAIRVSLASASTQVR